MASLCIITLATDRAGADNETISDEALLASSGPPQTDLNFQIPHLSVAEENRVLSHYQFVDPKEEVPTDLLRKAILFYDYNLDKVLNRNYLSVVDFSRFSGRKRFFIIDMRNGQVISYHVAHGSGSDPKSTGYAKKFSNEINSDTSSIGYYLAQEIYQGKHGLSMRLDGLSDTNSMVRARDVVVHGADYVTEVNRKQGRSSGCLAVSMNTRNTIVQMLNGGSVIYADRSKK